MKLLHAHTRIPEDMLRITAEELLPYRDRLEKIVKDVDYAYDESSINLPSDDALLKSVLEIVKRRSIGKIKYFIVIGIGGSNLGTKAIYDALFGHFDTLESDRFPKMIFFDTAHEPCARRFVQLVESEE